MFVPGASRPPQPPPSAIRRSNRPPPPPSAAASRRHPLQPLAAAAGFRSSRPPPPSSAAACHRGHHRPPQPLPPLDSTAAGCRLLVFFPFRCILVSMVFTGGQREPVNQSFRRFGPGRSGSKPLWGPGLRVHLGWVRAGPRFFGTDEQGRPQMRSDMGLGST